MRAAKIHFNRKIRLGALICVLFIAFFPAGTYADETHFTPELIKYAQYGLKKIFKKGYLYKKAGVIMLNLIPEHSIQGNLFYKADTEKTRRLMHTVDFLNRSYGRDKVRVSAQGYGTSWKLLQQKLSPCYTTRMKDLLEVF